jgi:hypothetical protein
MFDNLRYLYVIVPDLWCINPLAGDRKSTAATWVARYVADSPTIPFPNLPATAR